VPVLPGAEPYRHEGGRSEFSLPRFHRLPSRCALAEYLAERGLPSRCPLLPGLGTRPGGHALTSWQELVRGGGPRGCAPCAERCSQVFVAGLSMGGALACGWPRSTATRSAAWWSSTLPSRCTAGGPRPSVAALRAYGAGIASYIAKEGGDEVGTTGCPLHSAHSLRIFFRLVDRELPAGHPPLLLLRSPQDHVVPPADSGPCPWPGFLDGRDGKACWNRATTSRRWNHDGTGFRGELPSSFGRLAPRSARGVRHGPGERAGGTATGG